MQGSREKRNKEPQEGSQRRSYQRKGELHKKSRGSKHRSATPKNGAGAKHYCTELGQNQTHSTDNCYTLKNRASRGDRTSGSGNKKSFRNEINMILSREKPRKKFLEMFSTFVEQEQEQEQDLMATQKKSAKKPNKAKTKSRRGSRDDDSSESESEMFIACINQATDEIDEANSYQSRIENLGTITDDKWRTPVVTNTSKDEFNNYTNECYVTAAALFNPAKN